MGRKIVTIVLLSIGVLLSSCGSSKGIITKKKKESVIINSGGETPDVIAPDPDPTEKPKAKYFDKVETYIDTFDEVAMKEMSLYGVPASITLAQGILESGIGNGRLALEANNHFGIKCHTGWTGKRIYHDDDEAQECFRVYKDPGYSYRDHSLFLFERKRYAFLFKLPQDDYKNWAKGLRKAGYATDRKYPSKLIKLIKKYELWRYDAIVLGKSADDADEVVDKQDRHTVKKGETLYRIARKYKLTVAQIKEYNSLESEEIFPGQVLFVQPIKKDF